MDGLPSRDDVDRIARQWRLPLEHVRDHLEVWTVELERDNRLTRVALIGVPYAARGPFPDAARWATVAPAPSWNGVPGIGSVLVYTTPGGGVIGPRVVSMQRHSPTPPSGGGIVILEARVTVEHAAGSATGMATLEPNGEYAFRVSWPGPACLDKNITLARELIERAWDVIQKRTQPAGGRPADVQDVLDAQPLDFYQELYRQLVETYRDRDPPEPRRPGIREFAAFLTLELGRTVSPSSWGAYMPKKTATKKKWAWQRDFLDFAPW